MTIETFPSTTISHRRADIAVHSIGLTLILFAGTTLLINAAQTLTSPVFAAVVVFALCAIVSNLASWAYHFAPWHTRRKFLRRIDHSAIYLGISGTFTPFFVQAGTSLTFTLLWVCWGLTAIAIWKKLTDENVKSKWSTASYLGLGAVGLCAFPDLGDIPVETRWCVLTGSACYVIGTLFYVRKAMPFRYATWHMWVNFGGVFMFAGVWIALF